MNWRNPWAARWAQAYIGKHGGFHKKIMRQEAIAAENMPAGKCDVCKGPTYYRPGAGEYQCWNCRKGRQK